MDPQQALQTAQGLGLSLPSPGYLVAAIVFGLAGLVAWRVGRRQERPLTVALGVALMVYPYFVSRTWLVWAIGVALCAGIWFDRER